MFTLYEYNHSSSEKSIRTEHYIFPMAQVMRNTKQKMPQREKMMSKNEPEKKLGKGAYVSTTMMSFSEGATTALMTTVLLIFLTDYAGLGEMGAKLGAALLFGARLLDAVDDTVQSWIVDRAKPSKLGKYRPFMLASILLSTFGAALLFSIPATFSNKYAVICVWVVLAYLIYDIGASFNVAKLLYRTMTTNEEERGKLVIGPRAATMIISTVAAVSLTPIVVFLQAKLPGGYQSAYNLTMPAFVILFGAIALIGWFFVKEEHPEVKEEEDEVKLTDIFLLFKENPPFRVNMIGSLFVGFMWTFLFSAADYYVKYAYCVDLGTGVLDDGTYAILSLVVSLMMVLPTLLGTFIAMPVTRRIGDPMKTKRVMLLIEGIFCAGLFLCQITGILLKSPVILFFFMFVIITAMGINFVPSEICTLEIMDYNIYVNGRNRSAQCNAAGNFLNKMQTAFATGIIGVMLTAIGYEVNSVTGDFAGDLAVMPTMLNMFMVIMGLIPAALSFIGYFIFRKYPIDNAFREEMRQALQKNSI